MIHEFTIQYTTIDDNGNDKNVKENYVTEKFNSFAETEDFALEEFASLVGLDVIAIKRSKVKEIANTKTNDNDLVYEATIQETFVMDDGVEKVQKYRILLFAPTFDGAKSFISEYLKQGYNDMELVSLKLTKIKDVV